MKSVYRAIKGLNCRKSGQTDPQRKEKCPAWCVRKYNQNSRLNFLKGSWADIKILELNEKRPKWVKLGPLYLNFRRRLKLKLKWGGRWDLNPRQPESQSGALPTELRPPQ